MTGHNAKIRVYKIFLPWQDDREENWLHEMAAQGWQLNKVVFPCTYTFEKSQPANTIYRLDYFDKSSKEHAEYLQFFVDAGWEFVGQMGGWQYFRKSLPPGESVEIFTDNESKIAKLKRVMGFYGTMLAALVPIFLSTIDGWGSYRMVLFGLYVLLMVLYVLILVKLNERIKRLKQL